MTARPLLPTSLTAVLASAAAAQQAPEGFELSPTDAVQLDRVLSEWERRSGEVRTFSCDFTRLVYDPVFGPGADVARAIEQGTVSYQQPDKGSFQIKESSAWDAKQQSHVANPDAAKEHWVCDGRSVYEYKHEAKQLVERPIPPEMQGKNIADGPLPFLFGAEAEKLKARYWLRVDPQSPPGAYWLVAMPKRQADAANYRRVELMLDAQRVLPSAMRVTAPDGSRTTYEFDLAGASINSRVTELFGRVFQAPSTPWGWKRVVEAPTTAQAPTGAAR